MKELRDIKLDLLMGNQNPIVDLFNKITNGVEIVNTNVYNEDGLEFIYHKDGEWIFYQDVKNEKFWTHYYRYWSIFEEEFYLSYKEIQSITKLLVEEALKRELSTPSLHVFLKEKMVEEALKREVSTPLYKERGAKLIVVEEALKQELSKPDITNSMNSFEIQNILKKEIK